MPASLEGQKSPQTIPLDGETVFRAAGSVSIAIMISRALGLIREMVMARYFGAGIYTDAFNVAYRIPNLLRDLFAEGALSSAFVPNFIRCLNQSGAREAWLLANRVVNALLLILGAVTLLFFFGARGFVYLLAAGYAEVPEKFELTLLMTRIMSPFLLWTALASVAMGVINSCGSFFLPALASSAFNICCILAGIFLSPLMPRWGLDPVVSMAIGALVGGFAQFLVQVPQVYKYGFRYRPGIDFSDPGLRRIATLMLPAVLGLSATQINIAVDCQLASHYGNGPVSWLNYAFRLMQFPIGVFGIAIASVTAASVSHWAAQNNIGKLRSTLQSSLRLAACFTFPATVGLILFRKEIVSLLYERGSFLSSDALRTSEVLSFYALALFSYSAVKILVPAFYALEDTHTPVRASLTTVAVKIAINFVLIIPLGFLGLALATTLASWLSFGLLAAKMARRTGARLALRDLEPYLRIAAAALIMGAVALMAQRISQNFFGDSGTLTLALNLGVAIFVGMGSMLVLLHLFRIREVQDIFAFLRPSFFGKTA
jgi:putative peptidoglycan lipid II flippase